MEKAKVQIKTRDMFAVGFISSVGANDIASQVGIARKTRKFISTINRDWTTNFVANGGSKPPTK